jgi:hypothetical protein
MMKRYLLAVALMLGGTSAALAAPFCVNVTGIPQQCLYVDAANCQREASRLGGRCTANPAELMTPVSAARYCLALGGGIMSCVYPAYADCETDAGRLGGACIATPPPSSTLQGISPTPGVDLFAARRP